MRLRRTSLLALVPLATAIAACSAGAPAAPSSASGGPSQTPAVAATNVPITLPAPTVEPISTAAPTATSAPDEGNVDGPGTPDLSIEPVGSHSIRVTLADAPAKAWQVIVQGTGDQAGNRWVLEVETGDVAPVITTVDTRAGVAGEPQEQTGLETGSPRGRVCSAVLPVCVAADSVDLPHDGNGTLVLVLTRGAASPSLGVSAATAGWPTDPFVLGPWTTTEVFAWAP